MNGTNQRQTAQLRLRIGEIARKSGKSINEIMKDIEALIDFGLSPVKALAMVEEKYNVE